MGGSELKFYIRAHEHLRWEGASIGEKYGKRVASINRTFERGFHLEIALILTNQSHTAH